MPDISSADAKMWLTLVGWGVRFYYRLPVSKWSNPPVFAKTLLPAWAPEFYLPNQKTVIVVLGTFFGAIPAVISQVALGQAILRQAGWKMHIATEFDLEVKGPGKLLAEWGVRGDNTPGTALPNPYGIPDTMARFRRMQATSAKYISTNVRVTHGPSLGRQRGPGRGERLRRGRVGRGFQVRRGYRRRRPYAVGGRRDRT
jgi:hypothetical protein